MIAYIEILVLILISAIILLVSLVCVDFVLIVGLFAKIIIKRSAVNSLRLPMSAMVALSAIGAD